MKHEINRPPMAVILAAGIGSQLSPLTDDCPKSLLPVGGSAILERILRNCLSCGISQFVLVLGHHADQIKQFVDKTFRGIRVTYVVNDRYRSTGTGHALMLAAPAIGTSEFIKFDAGVVFDVKVLRELVDSERDNVVCIDRNMTLAAGDVKVIADNQMQVLEVGVSVDGDLALGGAIGIEKISAKTGSVLFAELTEMMDNPAHYKSGNEIVYSRLLDKGTTFQTIDITGLNWTSVSTDEDFSAANAMFGTPVTTVSRGQQRAIDEAAEKPAGPA